MRCGQIDGPATARRRDHVHQPARSGDSNSSAQRIPSARARAEDHGPAVAERRLRHGCWWIWATSPPQMARRIPLTSWFRFRRAVENTSDRAGRRRTGAVRENLRFAGVEDEGREFEAETKMSGAQSDIGDLFGTRPNDSSARRGPVAVRRAARTGYPDTQCYPDFERVPARRDRQVDVRSWNSGATLAQPAVKRRRSKEVNQLPHIPEAMSVSHADLLDGWRFEPRSSVHWQRRKPPQSAHAQFHLQLPK